MRFSIGWLSRCRTRSGLRQPKSNGSPTLTVVRSLRGFAGGQEDAVLEAALIHLRNLDDFLRSKGRDTEIKAHDWVQNWNPGLWLDPRVRARIEQNIAHMSALRENIDWKPCEYGAALCEAFANFFDAVAAQCPDRLAAFGDAPDEARRRALVFAKYV